MLPTATGESSPKEQSLIPKTSCATKLVLKLALLKTVISMKEFCLASERHVQQRHRYQILLVKNQVLANVSTFMKTTQHTSLRDRHTCKLLPMYNQESE